MAKKLPNPGKTTEARNAVTACFVLLRENTAQRQCFTTFNFNLSFNFLLIDSQRFAIRLL
ncbi:hypothetical protein D3C87_2062820 [compost metagenome]